MNYCFSSTYSTSCFMLSIYSYLFIFPNNILQPKDCFIGINTLFYSDRNIRSPLLRTGLEINTKNVRSKQFSNKGTNCRINNSLEEFKEGRGELQVMQTPMLRHSIGILSLLSQESKLFGESRKHLILPSLVKNRPIFEKNTVLRKQKTLFC